MKSVRFITLGCKVNQYETQGMRESLARAGVTENTSAGDGCDFVVINTCTVTDAADKENRYWIRRMRRQHPEAKIVITGCYAERNREAIESLPGVDLVIANHDKARIADYLERGCGDPDLQDEMSERKGRREYAPLSISRFQGHGRAFVKIQDGCNHACSFCKVVLVRGRSRSRPLQDIVTEVNRLRDAGYREAVFTGIQLGAYGADSEQPLDLVDVLRACSEIEGIERLRLSSIEPTDVRPNLIAALSELPKCCPHLHIPLQSGDDAVLAAMNRRYRHEFYADLVEELRSKLPDFSLSLDVMAGFPSESEEQFENTCALLKSVRPLKCHVFPYSLRDGTKASKMDSLDPSVVRSRVNRLIGLADELGEAERSRYIGQSVDVLVEKELHGGGMVQGLTSNYLKVCFKGDADLVGRFLRVELLSLQGDTFLARGQRHVMAV
ncbi:MAG: tRNA (N(6)-L-threonylcarbamoyladenosine(37)-C(2))-methylthiotransferase MtaB [Candidatus Omnitrophota bacterium]|nr:tRNA (N(6)-L-threonylcarbamoyladenosine(37)-C(2))-methylthiotransferase MtaB [Candidatus Omnitrophota bacterium]